MEWKLLIYFNEQLEYVTAIWQNLWPFGIACGLLVYYPVLVYLDQEKSGNPGNDHAQRALFV
jgi:hypothetical protein